MQKELSDANVVRAKILSAFDSTKETMKAEEKKKKSLLKQKEDVSPHCHHLTSSLHAVVGACYVTLAWVILMVDQHKHLLICSLKPCLSFGSVIFFFLLLKFSFSIHVDKVFWLRVQFSYKSVVFLEVDTVIYLASIQLVAIILSSERFISQLLNKNIINGKTKL